MKNCSGPIPKMARPGSKTARKMIWAGKFDGKNMKILVTGSAGHLGEALMHTLKNTDHEAVGTDVLNSPFTNRVGSVADREHVKKCMSGVDVVIHPATLHKPHIVTHSKQDFVDTNITGTLNLLEEALLAGVQSFVFTSTTSAFGDALRPAEGGAAVWVTENLVPVPKNIYGATKIAAENLCQLFSRNHGLPCLVLRTSRFFPEEDDRREAREKYADLNLKVNEFLHRRVDIEDVVSAHLLAVEKGPEIGFGRYIISATTPFMAEDVMELAVNAPAVVRRRAAAYEEIYARLGWKMFPRIGRVYDSTLAREQLGWSPRHDFKSILSRLENGDSPQSTLARRIGRKGYHDQEFSDGPYPVN